MKKQDIAKKMHERPIDKANANAKPVHSIFKGRDYLGTPKDSSNYKKNGFKYPKPDRYTKRFGASYKDIKHALEND